MKACTACAAGFTGSGGLRRLLRSSAKTPEAWSIAPQEHAGAAACHYLNGNDCADAVWIFQIPTTLTTASRSKIVLINGAKAANVFWMVGSSATLGTYSIFKGDIMAAKSITVTTGVDVEGRVLARNAAVTLDTDSIHMP